jgi:hypothetical protein
MPFKHHAAHRHRIPQARYRVRNWREYEAGLKRRGDLTLWLEEAAIAEWQAPRRSNQAVARRQPDPPPDVVIPPRSSAVPSTDAGDPPSRRDRHVRLIAEKGRMAWQRATGYGRRSLAETAVGRHKAIIGPRLRARSLPAQQGEAVIAVAVLNRMIRTAKPISVRVA